MPSDPRIDELDEPPQSARPGERETQPPPFELGAFAQEFEGAGTRATLPPAPTYEMLRDSCKTMAAAEAMSDEDDGVEAIEMVETTTDLGAAGASPIARKAPPLPPRRL